MDGALNMHNSEIFKERNYQSNLGIVRMIISKLNLEKSGGKV
jgi:hypothetical protein